MRPVCRASFASFTFPLTFYKNGATIPFDLSSV